MGFLDKSSLRGMRRDPRDIHVLYRGLCPTSHEVADSSVFRLTPIYFSSGRYVLSALVVPNRFYCQ